VLLYLNLWKWDITELRNRKEMFESPDSLYFQCSVQSFQSCAGIFPEQQEASSFVCNDGLQHLPMLHLPDSQSTRTMQVSEGVNLI